jgi:hypothetical protein
LSKLNKIGVGELGSESSCANVVKTSGNIIKKALSARRKKREFLLFINLAS